MTEEDKDHESESRFRRLRRTAGEILDSERLRDAVEVAKEVGSVAKDVGSLGLEVATGVASRGSRAVAAAYRGTRNTITQEEAWEQMEQAISDLTDVVRVQHAMILDLQGRVDRLEAAARQAANEKST